MEPTSLLAILRTDLELIPYIRYTVKQLSNADKTARLLMFQRFRQEIENDNEWIRIVWFTVEAHFYLNGILNSQNCSI